MDLSVNTIFIPNNKANNNCSFFYKIQPELPELGVLIFGIDTTLKTNQFEKILKLFFNLSDNYFLKQDITDPLGCFENVLNEFNTDFVLNFKEQNIWSKKINLTIALLIDNKLHFANYGNNHLLLLRQKNYIDVIKQVSANLYIPGKKIFDQIYSGPITNFPRIALVNQAIFDYLSIDNIKKIFNLLPIKNIGNQIEQLTINTFINQNLSGIILINPANLTLKFEDKNIINLSAEETIKSLETKTAETQKYLHPKYLPDITNIKTKLKNIWLPNKKKLVYNNNQSLLKFNNYFKRFKDFPTDLINFNRKIKHKKDDFLNILKNSPGNLIFAIKLFKNKIKLLSGLSKFLLATALILLVALLTNLSLMGISNNTNINTEYFTENVNKINNLHNEAQAAIIYGDNQKARKILGEALNLISSLPKNNTERENINKELFNKNSELMAEANKLTVLSNLTNLIDIKNFTSDKIISGGLASSENNLYILTNNNLFKLNLINRDIIATNLPAESPLFLISDQNNLLVYFKNNSIYLYKNESNIWQELKFNWPNPNFPITGAIYNDNIYLVNDNNQIIRYNRSGDGFINSQTWLGTNQLPKIKSLAIDGSIYTWHENGDINKFTRGQLDNFSVEPIEPIIRSSFQIITANDIPALYLLDNNNQRIIIYNKDGKLIKQYKFDVANQIKSMTVTRIKENNKRLIYLINDDNIYELLVDE